MLKNTVKVAALLLMGVSSAATFTACSNDDNVTTDGGIVSSETITFGDGSQIGNGDKEMVFTGKQTLTKGTYTLKGWVYVADEIGRAHV